MKLDHRTMPVLVAFVVALVVLGLAVYVVVVNDGSTAELPGIAVLMVPLAGLVAAFLGKKPPRGPL